MIKKIAILGAGNGGCAFAGYLAIKGFEVNLYENQRFKGNIIPIKIRGGIEVTGLINGFGKLKKVTTDIREAVDKVDIIMIVVPGSAQAIIARECAPHLKNGQTVVINSSSTGAALEFFNIIKEEGKEVIVGETMSLLYACRKTSLTKVNIMGIKKEMPVAAFPAKNTKKMVNMLRKLIPNFILAKNVMETSLNNLNAVAHPAITILNTGWIESDNEFDFYKNGLSKSVKKVMMAVDTERIKIAKVLQVEAPSDDEWMQKWYGVKTYKEATKPGGVYSGIKAPSSIQVRFITEDVPYGLVPISSIGKEYKIQTPVINSLIKISSTLMGVDYWEEGRTAEKLGISGMGVKRLNKYLTEGKL